MMDVAAARADTPGCASVTHLDNAGAALPPRPVLDAVIGHLELEARIGGYPAAEDAAARVAATYAEIAALLGCRVDEIALVDSATRAWTAWFGALPFAAGDRILTHRVEYASNYLAMLQLARRAGVSIEVVPSAPTGEIDVDALAAMIDDRVRLVALTHVPSQSGLVNPAAAVGAVTRAAGVAYLLDACQSAGQLPLSVDAIGCDALVATGRKFLRGPRGTGFLYARRDRLGDLEPHAPDLRAAEWTGPDSYRLRADARRFEQWERSVAGVLGLGAAVRYARGVGLDAISDRVTTLAAELRDRLVATPGVRVHDEGSHRSGIVTFTRVGEPPTVTKARLLEQRVNVSVIEAPTARLDLDARGLPAVVRASVHYYNTSEELDRLVGAVRDAR